MVTCSEFLDGYSDYRDGGLDDARCAAFREHARHCSVCADYDRVVCGGVRVLQQLPALEFSEDFIPRLQHRLMHMEDERALSRSTARATGTTMLGIAAALVLASAAPLLRADTRVPELPPVVAHAPHPVEHVSGLFVAAPGLMPASASLLTWLPPAPRLDLRAVALLSSWEVPQPEVAPSVGNR